MRAIALLLSTACVNLPPGWEDAERLPSVTQSPCDGSPYEEAFEEAADGFLTEGGVQVIYDPVHFRCEQPVEGFWRQVGEHVDVLLQPRDMNPSVVAACDCLYRVEALVPAEGVTSATAWRRWDDLNDANDPVEISDLSMTR